MKFLKDLIILSVNLGIKFFAVWCLIALASECFGFAFSSRYVWFIWLIWAVFTILQLLRRIYGK